MESGSKFNLSELRDFLKLSEKDRDVDWDLILANADWVDGLLNYYESEPLINKEKYVLMQLLIASYDEKLQLGKVNPELEKRLFHFIKTDFNIHEETLNYWARLHEPETEGWKVTPLIRKIWFDIKNRNL